MLNKKTSDSTGTPTPSTMPVAGRSAARRTLLPVIAEGPFGYPRVNVADQRRDPSSMLNWTERVVRMRKQCPEIGWGDFRVVGTRDRAVLALLYEWRHSAVLCVHNVTGEPRTTRLRVGGEAGRKLVNLLSNDHSEADARGEHALDLEPWGYRWFRVGGLDDVLKRTAF